MDVEEVEWRAEDTQQVEEEAGESQKEGDEVEELRLASKGCSPDLRSQEKGVTWSLDLRVPRRGGWFPPLDM